MKTSFGFTLIELIIVVTIIAILVGGALPYAQQYIEDTRYSKAKQDLDEIKNALIRFETDQNRVYTDTSINGLVGPYLTKGMADPWGSPYLISHPASKCYSVGPDRQDNTGDELEVEYRPPLAISRAFWEDSNKNQNIDSGDALLIKFTRPVRRNAGDGPQTDIGNDDFVFSAGAPDIDYSSPIVFVDYDMFARIGINYAVATPFRTGLDSITVKNNNTIVDGDNNKCKSDSPVVIKPR
ncbi:MAG: prepilin-type N-terminal cleavage/methylation domain-containing protein [Candidatus Riflebacteria bacterium]